MKDIFLVDADDTILDFHGASDNAIRFAFSKFNIPWQDEYAIVYKRVNDGLWAKLERREISRAELIHIRFKLYLQELKMPAINADAFNELYLTHLATSPLFVENAKEFLQELKIYGRIYIVTNGTKKIQQSRFAICKLNDMVDGVFISQEIGYDKPAKEFTEYAISHIDGFTKERAVWIGDSLSADIRSANEFGITSIWFNPNRKALTGTTKPDYIVDNFDEIFEILQRISV